MEHYIKNLLKYIKSDNGFYIEAGANDGITQSYTYELEKLGWTGILIEPSVRSFTECVRNRSNKNNFYCGALVALEDVKSVNGDFDGSLMSSVNGVRLNKSELVDVPSRTLNSVLKEFGIRSFDLLSLDAEGYEFAILKGFNIDLYTPKYIIIELSKEVREDIMLFMILHDYKVLANLTNWNYKENRNWDGVGNDYLFIKN
jgi:FkbM family methyltransferase